MEHSANYFHYTHMSPELQQYTALAIVTVAAGAMLWRFVRPFLTTKQDHDCASGCGHCPANKDTPRTELGQPLVQLQLKPMSKSKSRI